MHREQLASLDLNNFPSTIIQTGIPPSPTTTTHHVLKRISLFTPLCFKINFTKELLPCQEKCMSCFNKWQRGFLTQIVQ